MNCKIKSIAPWFGGKRTLAADIIKQLGPHTQYFEPFCGSMAVLLAKKPSQKETVNDLHEDMTNLARVVSKEDLAPQLYNRLQKTVLAEGILKDARDALESDEDDPLERAYWYFVASWMARNGTAGCERQDYQIAVRWTYDGGSPTVRFHNAIESIPDWHRRLLNVVIMNRNAFRIIDRFEDHERTAIYCDPPYLPETRSDMGATSRYLHEFEAKPPTGPSLFGSEEIKESIDPHGRLAEVLNGYKRARIVVSYYDCERARALYPEPKWTFIDKTMRKNINQQAARTKYHGPPKEAPETLIVNGPEFK